MLNPINNKFMGEDIETKLNQYEYKNISKQPKRCHKCTDFAISTASCTRASPGTGNRRGVSGLHHSIPHHPES